MGSWTEVTQWVEGVRCKHGKDGFWEQFQPGSGSLTLVNDDGRFDHLNATSPYYDSIRPMRRIKVEANLPASTLFSDDFPGSAFDPTKWSQIGSGGLTVSGSVLTVANPTSAGSRGVQALAATSFVDTSYVVGPVSAGISYTAPGFSAYPLLLTMTGGETASWRFIPTTRISAEVNGVSMWSDPFSAVTHAYMRIRRVGNTTSWETSTNGTTWTVRYSAGVALGGSDDGDGCGPVRRGGGARLVRHLVGRQGRGRPGWQRAPLVVRLDRRLAGVAAVPQAVPCGVSWHDALSLLGRTRLPDSVFEYKIAATSPYRWFRLNDTSSTAVDSGAGKVHGTYRVFEQYTPPWAGVLLPDSIQKEGTIDTIVPAGSKQAKNWAKLQAEVGQPPVGTDGVFPRTPRWCWPLVILR